MKAEKLGRFEKSNTYSSYSEIMKLPQVTMKEIKENWAKDYTYRVTYSVFEKKSQALKTWVIISSDYMRWHLNDSLEIYISPFREDYRLCSPETNSALPMDDKLALKYYRKFIDLFRPIPLPPPNMLEREEVIRAKYKDKEKATSNLKGLQVKYPYLEPFHILADPTLRTTSGIVLWVIKDKEHLLQYWTFRYGLREIGEYLAENMGITFGDIIKPIEEPQLTFVEVSDSALKKPAAMIMEDGLNGRVIIIDVEKIEEPLDLGPCENLLK